jgi:tetratricopeptide (TPR) repeat protein
MEMGDYDASIDNYRKALEIDPYFAASYAGITINESLKGNADLAQEAADQMLAAARNFGERQGAMFRSVTSHLFAGNIEAAMENCEVMLAEAEVAGNKAAMGGIHEYMGDILLSQGEPAPAEEHYNAALDSRLAAGFNEANQAQAERTHMFKTAIAAMMADDAEAAATRTAEYSAAAEMNGTAFEKRRVHELAGYLAMSNENLESAVEHFEQGNQLNPILLYWSAWANAELGNTDTAIDLATRAANRNTLNGNLPFFREDAQELLAKLTAE